MSGQREESLPACFAGLGAGSPRPRQKSGGMFCSVEDAFDNKTLNFASLGAPSPGTSSGGPSRAPNPVPAAPAPGELPAGCPQVRSGGAASLPPPPACRARPG